MPQRQTDKIQFKERTELLDLFFKQNCSAKQILLFQNVFLTENMFHLEKRTGPVHPMNTN